MKQEKTLNFPLSQKGELNYNLNERNLYFSHLDFTTPLGVNVSHIYHNQTQNKGYGRGVCLNLEQELKKITESNYLLSLASGKEESFEEIYYYKNENNEKIYKTKDGNALKRSDIELSLDGELSYEGNRIYIEIKSESGLTLISGYDGFKNADWIDVRNEELIAVEEEIIEVEQHIEDLTYQLNEYKKFEAESSYEKLKEAERKYQAASKSFKQLQLKELLTSEKEEYYKAKEDYQTLTKKFKDKAPGIKNVSQDSTISEDELQYQDEVEQYVYSEFTAKKAQIYDLKVKYKDFSKMTKEEKYAAYYNELFGQKVEEINQDLQRLANYIEKKEWDKQKKLLVSQNELATREEEYLNQEKAYEQEYTTLLKEYYNKLIDRTNLTLKKYAGIKKTKEYQKEKLKQILPKHFLIAQDGLIYGYNEAGKLCCIMDHFEQQLQIEFNEKNQIKNITDQKDYKIEFIYNEKNQLIRMQENHGEFLTFEYEQENIIAIGYASKECLQLNYKDNKLIEILGIDLIGYKIEYQNDWIKQIQKIAYQNDEFYIDEAFVFTYEDHQVLVSTNQSNSIQGYLFDEKNSLLTSYEKKEEIERVETYEKYQSHCSFRIQATRHAQKLFFKKEHITDEDGITSFEITDFLPNVREYLFYAFATAKSTSNIRERRITAYCNHNNDENDFTSYYELRCLIKYPTHQREYIASYNPKVTGKQFVALPITLDEDKEGNVLVPMQMLLFLDYRNNNDVCKFADVTLTTGDYVYYEYDEAHHKIYECYSEAHTITTKCFKKEKDIFQKKEIRYNYNPKDFIEEEITTWTTKIFLADGSLFEKEKSEERLHYQYNDAGNLVKQQSSTGIVTEYVYNKKEQCIKKKTYSIKEPAQAFVEETDYNENGILLAEKNELGYPMKYHYLNEDLEYITMPNENKIYMTKDFIMSDIDGQNHFVGTLYDKGKIQAYQSNGMRYEFTYDPFGRRKEVFINGQLYCRFSEIQQAGNIVYRTTYSNGNSYERICDLSGKLQKVNTFVNGKQATSMVYEYDDRGQLSKEKADVEEKEYLYIEDTLVGIKTNDYVKRIEKDVHSVEIYYEMDNNNYSSIISFDEEDKPIEYIYNRNTCKQLKEQYSYDALNRIKEKENQIIKTNYTYVTQNGRTTTLISKERKRIGDKVQTILYTYDYEGNIHTKEENQEKTRYTYDKLNRIIREDNEGLNETILYQYNENGNIVEKKICEYSTDDKLVNKENIEYNYKEFNDLLTNYNKKEIQYNQMGNPIQYGQKSIEWNHKELTSYGDIKYRYNSEGIRIEKRTPKATIKYTVDKSRILKEKRKHYRSYIEERIEALGTIACDEEEIEYIYSAEGIIGFDYISKGEVKRYLYNKNILGDIIEIYNEEGQVVGKYHYDAYGNHTVINYTKENIGDINPIRYRGYYYDAETGLYLVTTRYYNPEWCRFISPDSIEYLDPTNINGLNLYAYCYNNPINYVDPSGHFALLISLLIFTGAFTLGGAIYGGVSAGMAGGDVGDVFAGIGQGALNGLILGGGISLAIGGFVVGGTTVLGSIMATYGLSISANMIEVAITQGKKSYYDGDRFWEGANDITNAMFGNSGNILIGKPKLMSIPFYGTRMTSKIPTILSVLVSYDLDKLFNSLSFLTSVKTTLLGKVSPLGVIAGYGLTIWQYSNLIKSIVSTPDFEDSRWILY